MSAEDRFFARVVAGMGGCWIWTGSGGRYGSFMVKGRQVTAHVWSYEHHVGPVPSGCQVDHRCVVTRCVNPAHLRPLTPKGNTLAYWREQRGTCRNGHPKLEGAAFCYPCRRARQSRYRKARTQRKKVA